MDEEEIIEQENVETAALAQARQEETEQEQETETDYAEPAPMPSVGFVEFFLMLMLALVFWLLALIPYVGFLFSGIGIFCIWLWYKFKHLEPPSFNPAGKLGSLASAGAGEKAGAFIQKLPGGSDFLFFFGAFAIDGIPFLDFIPALPALVIAIYLANR